MKIWVILRIFTAEFQHTENENIWPSLSVTALFMLDYKAWESSLLNSYVVINNGKYFSPNRQICIIKSIIIKTHTWSFFWGGEHCTSQMFWKIPTNLDIRVLSMPQWHDWWLNKKLKLKNTSWNNPNNHIRAQDAVIIQYNSGKNIRL